MDKEKKIINFEVDEVEVLDEQDDSSQFATARIHAFSSGENLHKMNCSIEVLKSTAYSIDNAPLLYNYDSMFQTRDFGTHTDPQKSLIAGFILPKSQEFFELNDGTGRVGLRVLSKIWKRYVPQAMKIFEQKSVKPVSVEIELNDFEERIDGIIEMKDFAYFGVCLLGNLIEPASPGANIEILSFSKDNKEIKQAYELEFSDKYKTRYSEIDFTIPEKIKKNAKKGLESGRSSAVYMAVGNHLSKSEKVSTEKIRFINKHIKSKIDSGIDFMLMGGKDSIDWSKQIVEIMDEKDSKVVSYFGDIAIFPYSSISEMNPALKGIEPPITLNQGNHIAKVADSSSWGIAISQFKKTHHAEDGKWVENEKKEVKNSMDEKIKDEEVKDENVAAENKEDVKKESIAEEKKESPSGESKETPEEEKAETPEEEKVEKKSGTEKKMSLDSYMDVAAVMGFLVKQTKDNEAVAAKYANGSLEDKEFADAMFASMCKMSEDLEKYAAENEELKKFKADIEKERFSVSVESFMQEMSKDLPKEEFEKAKEDSANFSMDTIDEWKNKVKVTAFNFSRKDIKEKKQDFVAIAMPFLGNQSNSGESNSPWTRK